MKRIKEDKFYEYYFKEISEKKKIPLNYFYKPNKKKNEKSQLMNNNYLRLIFMSKKFKKDFGKVLKNQLKEVYGKIIRKQLDKFLKRC